MRSFHSVIGCLVIFVSSTLLFGADKVFSGPQPGEAAAPFKVLQVTSPTKSKEIEIRAAKKGTMLLAFMHKINEPAIGLSMTLEWYAHQQKEISDSYVLLTDDRGKTEQLAKRWAKNPFYAKALMNISVDGSSGPGKYGLNRNVLMTVLVVKNGEVTHNFALKSPNNTDAPRILTALAKSIGKPVPNADKLWRELLAERKKRRAKKLTKTVVFKLAPNEQLGRIMVNMFYRERINEASATRVVGQLKEWAGKDEKKKSELLKYCRAILKGKHAKNRYAREALEKLVADADGE